MSADDTKGSIVRGVCDDGVTGYVPGVNCGECGRFVGRDGYISIGTFEMSDTVAYVEGECARCLRMAADRREQDARRTA